MKSFTFSSGCPPSQTSPLMLSFFLLECLHFLVLLASFFLAPNPRMSISTSTVFLHTSHPSPTYPFWSSHSLFLLGSCHRLSSQLTNELNHHLVSVLTFRSWMKTGWVGPHLAHWVPTAGKQGAQPPPTSTHWRNVLLLLLLLLLLFLLLLLLLLLCRSALPMGPEVTPEPEGQLEIRKQLETVILCQFRLLQF